MDFQAKKKNTEHLTGFRSNSFEKSFTELLNFNLGGENRKSPESVVVFL